jgi:membrane protein YdbS with pleckstrin-like domain
MVSGVLNKKFKLNMICSLLGSMLAGRIAAGIVVAVILYVFGFKNLGNPVIYVWGGIITGLPGIVIQLIVVPAFLTLLKKSRVMQEGSSVDT